MPRRLAALVTVLGLVAMGAGGCGSTNSNCFATCSDQVFAQVPEGVSPSSAHTVKFTVCRAGQCANGSFIVDSYSVHASLAVPGADCDVDVLSNQFEVSCAPSGAPIQTGEQWSVWAEDDGPASDAALSSSTVLLDVKRAITLQTVNACGTICHTASLN